jgi:NHL repeat
MRASEREKAMNVRSEDIQRWRGRARVPLRVLIRSFGAALICAAASLVCSAPALGLYQRGHAWAFSFGEAGEGAGQFRFGGSFKLSEPAGVAVDEATGDVYVVDRGNDRIEQFRPILNASGVLTGEEFLAAWGYGVADGKEEYELCTSECRAGLPGSGKGQFKEAGAIAIDNSPAGHQQLYVDVSSAAKRPEVWRFPSDGEKPLGKLPDSEEGRVDGIAVDQAVTVWLYRGEEEEAGQLEAFSDGEKPQRLEERDFFSPLPCPKAGLAVDGTGEELYLGHELASGEGECPAALEREALEEGHDDEGKLARAVVAGKVSPPEAAEGRFALAELGRANEAGIAVDQASAEGTPLGPDGNGDVYVDDGSSVASYTPSGELIQRFGSGELSDGEGIAIDAKTGYVYAVDGANDRVDVFEPETQAEPTVEGLSAQNTATGEAQLSAKIDSDGLATDYYFQYGTADCASNELACTDLPAAPGGELAGSYDAQGVTVAAGGLAPSTTYFYRVLASNADGAAQGEQRFGSFTTLPSSQGVLADGRAWEMVSPAEKDGAGIEAIAREGSLIQASSDGEAITYVANGPLVAQPQGNRAPELTQVLSARDSEGWASDDLTTLHENGEGLEAGEPSEFRAFSSDLALSVLQPPGGKVEPQERPPLAPAASEKTIYERADPPLSPQSTAGATDTEQTVYAQASANAGFLAPGYLPLVTPATDTQGSSFGGRLEFLDATPDLGHVVFESGETLLQDGASGLYEWSAGSGLQLVSILPDGQPAGEVAQATSPELGAEDVNVRGAVSDDGSRVFFYASGLEEGSEVAEFQRLYMRDTQRGETLQVNAAAGVSEPVGEESQVAFQGASANGSKVFFTDSAPLTPESAQRPLFGEKNPGDLYECEITEAQGELACDLKDLTPNPAGGSGDVLNVLSGISEDGSTVFFVANGVLASGASQGDCEAEGTPVAEQRCNLYLYSEGTLSFIASLSGEDSGDWGSIGGPFKSPSDVAPRPDLADLTARVSPNGQYFAFMSKQPLTGYDNEDAVHPGVRDQEVYLYDAASRLLSCVSCDASGPSSGVLDTEHAGEGQGLLVDRRGDWSGQYLAGSVPGWMPSGLDRSIRQPRYLSNEGRLFFDSPDQLVEQATNGREDVFEYEPTGVGSCDQLAGCVSLISSGTAQQESAFLEASENGDDAFFITSQPLVAADRDTNFDVYDARVCTSTSPCLTSQASSLRPCESTQTCKPASTPPPAISSPPTSVVTAQSTAPKHETQGSTTTQAAGKAKPPTRAQELAKALRRCRKDRRKHKRIACERRAHERYHDASGKARGKTKRASSRRYK